MDEKACDLSVPYLPTPVLEMILTFVDIPTLGASAQASKRLIDVACRDSVWRSHLELLLYQLYDNCRKGASDDTHHIAPLSKRPMKSTEVAKWFHDHHTRLLGLDVLVAEITEMPLVNVMRHPLATFSVRRSVPPHYQWFWEDVPLREYYRQAAEWAIWAEFQYEFQEMDTEDKCAVCLNVQSDEDCLCGYYVMERFRDNLHNRFLQKLPSINLFQRLPYRANPSHEYLLQK